MKAIYATLIAGLVSLAACQGVSAQRGINKELQVAEYEKRLAASPGAQLVDVRTPGEYAEGHLENAKNIDYNSDAFANKIAKLDKAKPVFVYCLSGGRSGMAAEQMHNMGFAEVYNMKGGIMKWNAEGKKIVTGKGGKPDAGMTAADFKHLTNKPGYVLVDYHAEWCGPCKRMAPYLESLAERKKDKLSLVKIDADKNKSLLKENGIDALPYLELYQNGKLTWKHKGFIDEKQFLKETKL
ncbi:MAG: thioredoxin [Bacteroidetes bacterium]|nr:thioredoxin [Bacteroidota bacterium]